MAELTALTLHRLATAALVGQGIPADVAPDVAKEFVIAEVSGVRTHGVGKIASLNLGDVSVRPTITRAGAILQVDGNGGNGMLLMRSVAGQLADIGMELGLALAAVRNHSRYSSLYPYTDLIARRGLVGILMNTAGPAAVAPFGACDPVTGTNPICFSFPTGAGGQTFDFATADRVWGEIRQASLEGRGLDYGPFLSADGEVTTVPSEVNAVRAFGGAKGSALNIAIELLAGPLVGAKAGHHVASEFDCGALMIAINPAACGAGSGFSAATEELLGEIRQCRPATPDVPVRAPGDKGRTGAHLPTPEHDVTVSVADSTVELLKRMERGERITELSANPLFN